MKKTILLLGLCVSCYLGFSQISLVNPGFETWSTIPSCSSHPVGNVYSWWGLKTTYGYQCSSYTDSVTSTPLSFQGDQLMSYYYSQYTSTCDPVSPHSGDGFIYCEEMG